MRLHLAHRFRLAMVVLLAVTSLLGLVGCPDKFKADEARQVVFRFYDRRLARAPVKDLLTPGLGPREQDFLGPSNPHPVAYHLVQLDRRGSRYRVSLVSVYTGQPASYLETEEVKIERRVRRYLIAEVRRRGRAEAVLSGRDLLLNVGGKPQGRLTLQELPAEVTPLGGEAPFGVGRDRFGPVAHNPNNPREIALSANGLHALAATALFPAAGRNKPAVKPVDLFFEGAITQIIWLPGNALVAVEVLTPAGATAINLYDVTERRRPARLHPDWEKRWRPPVNLRLRYFAGREKALIFTVAAPGRPDEDWAWKLGTGKIERWD